MKPFITFCLTLLVMGCANRNMDNGEVTSNTPRSIHYDLNKPERELLVKQGEAGDANAAYRLYLYYAIHVGDEVTSTKWLHIAAENGSTKAKNAIELLSENSDDETPARAAKGGDGSEENNR